MSNNVAFHITFDSLQLGTTRIDKADMLSAQSNTLILVPENTTGTLVSWRCITDYGNASDKFSTTLAQD